jgi:hypothetical protein
MFCDIRDARAGFGGLRRVAAARRLARAADSEDFRAVLLGRRDQFPRPVVGQYELATGCLGGERDGFADNRFYRVLGDQPKLVGGARGQAVLDVHAERDRADAFGDGAGAFGFRYGRKGPARRGVFEDVRGGRALGIELRLKRHAGRGDFGRELFFDLGRRG